jgi:hypothetical protein
MDEAASEPGEERAASTRSTASRPFCSCALALPLEQRIIVYMLVYHKNNLMPKLFYLINILDFNIRTFNCIYSGKVLRKNK